MLPVASQVNKSTFRMRHKVLFYKDHWRRTKNPTIMGFHID